MPRPSILRRAALGLTFVTVLATAGCATTLINPTATNPNPATTTTVPSGTPSALLTRLLSEAGQLSTAIGNDDGKGEQIMLVDNLWTAVRPAVAAKDGVLANQLDDMVALCQRGEKYNRPADADKCFRNLTELVDAYLAKYPS
ncbi:MAG: hypothetical protein JWM34_3827 [Ilumatobacteraceae bacterium]|nr:hypothetical protein [Ilumatobacteraceae bacterium]